MKMPHCPCALPNSQLRIDRILDRTLRHWLGKQQICHHRFTAFVEESSVFNVSRLAEPGTIFITALRDPLSRIVSSYIFEGSGSFSQWVSDVQKERAKGRPSRVWMEVGKEPCYFFYRRRRRSPLASPYRRSRITTPNVSAASDGEVGVRSGRRSGAVTTKPLPTGSCYINELAPSLCSLTMFLLRRALTTNWRWHEGHWRWAWQTPQKKSERTA